MTPWTIIGWIVLILLAVRVLDAALIGLGRWLERRTPEGRAAQACRDMADYLRRNRP